MSDNKYHQVLCSLTEEEYHQHFNLPDTSGRQHPPLLYQTAENTYEAMFEDDITLIVRDALVEVSDDDAYIDSMNEHDRDSFNAAGRPVRTQGCRPLHCQGKLAAAPAFQQQLRIQLLVRRQPNRPHPVRRPPGTQDHLRIHPRRGDRRMAAPYVPAAHPLNPPPVFHPPPRHHPLPWQWPSSRPPR